MIENNITYPIKTKDKQSPTYLLCPTCHRVKLKVGGCRMSCMANDLIRLTAIGYIGNTALDIVTKGLKEAKLL